MLQNFWRWAAETSLRSLLLSADWGCDLFMLSQKLGLFYLLVLLLLPKDCTLDLTPLFGMKYVRIRASFIRIHSTDPPKTEYRSLGKSFLIRNTKIPITICISQGKPCLAAVTNSPQISVGF